MSWRCPTRRRSSPRRLASFATLVAAGEHDDLALLLDDHLLALSDAGFENDPEGVFVERAPALGLLDGDLSTRDGLAGSLAVVDPRWQVDLVVALHHLLEGLDEETP